MAGATKATFGVPVAAAEPYQVASEIFEDVCDKWRRAVEAAAKLGNRDAQLDLVTIDRDLSELSREFDNALVLLGISKDERANQAERAKAEMANLRVDVENMAASIARVNLVIDALR